MKLYKQDIKITPFHKKMESIQIYVNNQKSKYIEGYPF